MWQTQDGKNIPIEKLEDGHLLNILRGGFAADYEFPALADEAEKRGFKDNGWSFRYTTIFGGSLDGLLNH